MKNSKLIEDVRMNSNSNNTMQQSDRVSVVGGDVDVEER